MQEKLIGRVWLSGFLLLGVLLGVLAPLLVVWQYQIDVEPHLIGLHFLAINVGYVIAAALAQRLADRIPPRVLAIASCALALVSLLWLALAAPPVGTRWRLASLLAVGFSAGGLGTALLYGYQEPLQKTPRAVLRASLLFGVGCLIATILIGATYFLGSESTATMLIAALPLVVLILFARTGSTLASRKKVSQDQLRKVREKLWDLRKIAIVLFSVLVFCQFGNEWAVAGWLPLFLIHRLGSNPALSIGVLAIYFLVLMLGRLIAQKMLTQIPHRRFLFGSIAIAISGFAVLDLARSLSGAVVAVILIAFGFAAIYPLVAEGLDHRFSYHAGFYHATISLAVTGAMSAPWLMGFIAAWLGMGYLMLLPAIGSVLVLMLTLLLMFEAHLMKDRRIEDTRSPDPE